MTDGIIEVQSSDGMLYTDYGRLEETIQRFAVDMPASEMVDAVIKRRRSVRRREGRVG